MRKKPPARRRIQTPQKTSPEGTKPLRIPRRIKGGLEEFRVPQELGVDVETHNGPRASTERIEIKPSGPVLVSHPLGPEAELFQRAVLFPLKPEGLTPRASVVPGRYQEEAVKLLEQVKG